MSQPPAKLDYRTLDAAERELVREADRRAQSAGCLTTVAVVFGFPLICVFLAAAWMNRHYVGAMLCFLCFPIVAIAIAVAFAREMRKDFRGRAFAGGMALGLAAIAGVVAIVASTTVLVGWLARLLGA